MKKKSKKKKQVRACAFGMGAVQGAGTIGDMIGSTVQGASKEGSGANIAGGALGGAAKGAMAGAALGPIGAVAGGVIGAAGGLFTGFKKKKEIEEKEKRELRIKLANIGANNAAENEMEYWDENELAYTYATGGIIPNGLAFLDNNEIIRNVDGNIEQVPNTKPGTDNHLVDATNLESVLSDKLKRPGTKRTFAQEGAILARMSKPSKGTDKFAENSNRLNKIAANKRYNELLIEQELVKQKKGIKPKTKGIATNEVPAYGDGELGDGELLDKQVKPLSPENNTTNRGKLIKEYFLEPMTEDVFIPMAKGIGNFITSGANQIMFDYNPIYQGIDMLITGATEQAKKNREYYKNNPAARNSNKRLIHGSASSPALYSERASEHVPENNYIDGITGESISVGPANQDIDYSSVAASSYQPTAYKNELVTTDNNKTSNNQVYSNSTNNTSKKTENPAQQDTRKKVLQADIYPDLYGGELARKPVEVEAPRQYTPDEIKTINKNRKAWDAKNARDAENGSTDWEQLASLAPTLYNFAQGLRPAEKESTVLNPNSGSISRALAKRRVNIEPARRENRKARAIANYNAANTNANTGMNLAVRNQIAASEYAQNADIYANRDNVNNTYLGEYANMMNNLGQQYIQSQTLTNDLNAKNRASSRKSGASAASQMGEWAQVNKQMKNKQRRDDMVYPLLENFLSQGYTSDQIKQIRKAHGSK